MFYRIKENGNRIKIYEVGNRVKIRKDLKGGVRYTSSLTGQYTTSTKRQFQYAGKQGIITRVCDDGLYYHIRFEGGAEIKEYWVDSMFAEEKKVFNSLLEGDKV